MDAGQKQTDKILKDMEKEIGGVYSQASKETQAKLDEYLRKFEVKDGIKRDLLAKGEITEAEYKQWRTGQIMISKRWEEMEEVLSRDMTNANLISASVINNHTPEAYAIGMNYGTFEIEKGSLLNTSFSLYDRGTVERLMKDNPDLLPKARIDIPKDVQWNKHKINSAVLQGVLQGEDIRTVSRRLQSVTDMNRHSAVRNARTMMTSAENGGRLDSYRRAGGMGIKLEKQWMATNDGRTRHSHAAQDGEHVPVDEEFGNGLMFPADPSGDPREVYNCRCTMVAMIEDAEGSELPVDIDLEDMDYEDWLEEHDLYPPETTVNAKVPDTVTPVPSNAVSAEQFVPTLDAAKSSCPDNKAWRVDTTRTIEDFKNDKVTMYVTKGGSTFALKDDGDIISVCKNQLTDADTNARNLLAAAVENGGTHLDSFDGNYGFYVRCGFEPVSRCKFDVDYAPTGWIQGRDKEEDIYFMRYVGIGNVKYTSIEDARLNIPYSDGYDEAEAVIKALVGRK